MLKNTRKKWAFLQIGKILAELLLASFFLEPKNVQNAHLVWPPMKKTAPPTKNQNSDPTLMLEKTFAI